MKKNYDSDDDSENGNDYEETKNSSKGASKDDKHLQEAGEDEGVDIRKITYLSDFEGDFEKPGLFQRFKKHLIEEDEDRAEDYDKFKYTSGESDEEHT